VRVLASSGSACDRERGGEREPRERVRAPLDGALPRRKPAGRGAYRIATQRGRDAGARPSRPEPAEPAPDVLDAGANGRATRDDRATLGGTEQRRARSVRARTHPRLAVDGRRTPGRHRPRRRRTPSLTAKRKDPAVESSPRSVLTR